MAAEVLEEPCTPMTMSLIDILRDKVSADVDDDVMEYLASSVSEELRDSSSADDSDLAVTLKDLIDATLPSPVPLSAVSDIIECVREQQRRTAADVAAAAAAAAAESDDSAAILESVVVGAKCLAVLSEDDEWHPAIVTEVIESGLGDEGGRYRVSFTEYGKPQEVSRSSLVLFEDIVGDDDEDVGDCPICKRHLPLTRHHVIPRTTHERMRKLGRTPEELNHTVDICRKCHSAVHRAADEYTLATEFNTLEAIMARPDMQRWAAYAAKLKTPGAKGGLTKECRRHIQLSR